MTRTVYGMLRGLVCVAAVWSGACLPAEAADWTYWRGPQYNGHSPETNLPDDWNPEGGDGSNVLWKRDDLGSRSTPIVMQGKLFLINNDRPDVLEEEGERVVCLDAATGETIWEHRFNVYLSDVPRERVGWSSVVGAPNAEDPSKSLVFAQGVSGYFCCLNAQTGDLVWEKSLHEEYGFLSTYGGRTNFPIVHENNVICSAVVIGWGEMAKPAHRFIAFDVRGRGEPVWFNGTRLFPEDTTYSAPVLATFNGRLAMVFGSGDGAVHAMEPRTGRLIWTFSLSRHGLNCTPLVVGDRVYIGNSEENIDSNTMGRMVCIDGTKSGDITAEGAVWQIDEMGVGRSTPIMVDDRLYVVDDQGKMSILNPDTGELIKRQPLGTMMRSSLLYADGKLYAGTADGRWYIMQPSEDGVEILSRGRLASGEEVHGSPIAANGRLYFPSTDAMYCLVKPDAEPTAAEPPPSLLTETDVKEDATPSIIQVAPVESLLITGDGQGDAQSYDVRLYNAKGQYLRTAKPEEVEFTIDGPGEIAISGEGANRWTYTIGGDNKEQAAVIVTAKFNDISGQSRIRVVPTLDWSYDFDDGLVPVTWVGIRYRHIVIDFDLYQKLAEQDPQAAALYLYFTTAFTNTGIAKQTYDNSTPAQKWSEFLRYISLDQGAARPANVDEAKAKIDASLKLLQDENVLAAYEWTTWDQPTGVEGETRPDPKLIIEKGDREFSGNGVMCKITTIPKGMRSQGWMGQTGLSNYTIQADVMGLLKNGKLPDIGLTAQRYTLDLMGASQQLQLRSWITQLERFHVNQPLTWEPEKWYTLKFQASVEDGKAVLRGKVWPRDETEPAEWMITGEDHVPNVIGSPGLFGNAKDSELFYDNLTVTRNTPAETETAEPPASQ